MKVTEPTNDLERAMGVAARGPQGYPELFRQLLAADLIVIMPGQSGMEGTFHVTAGDRITVVLWATDEEEVVPVFTSQERAREAIAAIGPGGRPSRLARISGAALFKVLQHCGTAVVINPACCGVEMRLEPPVVARLANRSILRPCDDAAKANGEAAVVQPEDYPAGVMAPVFHFLRGRKDVHAAWLLRMKPAPAGGGGLYVFAVLAANAGEELEGDLMIVLDNAGSGNVSCGMTMLDLRNPSHAALISEAAPFYEAPWYRLRAAAPEPSRATNRIIRLLRRRH